MAALASREKSFRPARSVSPLTKRAPLRLDSFSTGTERLSGFGDMRKLLLELRSTTVQESLSRRRSLPIDSSPIKG